MFPVFQIAGLSVQSSGLIILAGIWIALTLTEKYADQLNSDPEIISNLTFYAMITALLGARLSYAFRFPNAFLDHPASLFSLNPALLDPWGAALFAILAALIYGQRKNLSFLKTLDALTPGLAIMLVVISLSHLATGAAYGLPSNLPWAIELWGTIRHPSQIYSLLVALFILLLLLTRLISQKRNDGQLFFSFISLASFSRIFLDSFRGDSIPTLLNLRSSQIAAWLLLTLSLYFYYRSLKESQK